MEVALPAPPATAETVPSVYLVTPNSAGGNVGTLVNHSEEKILRCLLLSCAKCSKQLLVSCDSQLTKATNETNYLRILFSSEIIDCGKQHSFHSDYSHAFLYLRIQVRACAAFGAVELLLVGHPRHATHGAHGAQRCAIIQNTWHIQYRWHATRAAMT